MRFRQDGIKLQAQTVTSRQELEVEKIPWLFGLRTEPGNRSVLPRHDALLFEFGITKHGSRLDPPGIIEAQLGLEFRDKIDRHGKSDPAEAKAQGYGRQIHVLATDAHLHFRPHHLVVAAHED